MNFAQSTTEARNLSKDADRIATECATFAPNQDGCGKIDRAPFNLLAAQARMDTVMVEVFAEYAEKAADAKDGGDETSDFEASRQKMIDIIQNESQVRGLLCCLKIEAWTAA